MTPTMQIEMTNHGFPLRVALAASLTILLGATPALAKSAEADSDEKSEQSDTTETRDTETRDTETRDTEPDSEDAAPSDQGRSPAYGASLLKAESLGVSAGFHRWLGRAGTHYADCVGAVLLVAVDEPWLDNHFYFGAAFATAVGQYGDPDAGNIFAAAASTAEYLGGDRSFGGTAALPPLDFSYSTLAARAGYRLRTGIFVSGGAYIDLGYGLVGTVDDAQINGFVAVGANVIIKFFPTLIMTLGLQYRQDIPVGDRIAGFEDMSALAIYNSFELVKF